MFSTPFVTYICFMYISFIRAYHSSSATIIDVDKGVTLEQIGLYSEHLENSFLHIFIPLNKYCIHSSSSTICQHTNEQSPNIAEVTTIKSTECLASTRYSLQNISNLININIQRTLLHHQIREFITTTKSILYFVDNNFFISKQSNKLVPSILSSETTRQRLPFHQSSKPINLLLQQIFNGRIGYEFLTDEQRIELLKLPLFPKSASLDINQIEESIDMFKKMIVGQSFYILKSCSLLETDHSLLDSACLLVSTLFQRIPIDALSIYIVYRLTPVPVVINDNKYIYSTLASIVGVNPTDKTIVKWEEAEFASNCLSHNIIQCREYPVRLESSLVPCISNILGLTKDAYNACKVVRSESAKPNIMKINQYLWLFYSNDESYECLLHSNTDTSTMTMTITEPMIVKFPCEQSIHCSKVVIPPSPCMNANIIIRTNNNTDTLQHFFSVLPLKDITKRLLSAYESTTRNILTQYESETKTNSFSIDEIRRNVFNIIVSTLLLVLLTIFVLFLKYLKSKMERQMNTLQVELNKLCSECFDEL